MGRRRNKMPGFGTPDFLSESVDEFVRREEEAKRVEHERMLDAQLAMSSLKTGDWTLDEIHNLECAINELYKRDSQALHLYQPVPGAVAFHNSLAGERGLVGSNRSSKSVSASVEVAWAATRSHPIKDAYSMGNMDICVVGPRLEHLSLLYDMLFGVGRTFKVLKSGIDWQIPRWTDPEQFARRGEWIDAPPLIPPDMVAGEPSWYNKGANQPSIVRLKNGNNFYFFSMEQDAPRGVAFGLAWLDEEARGVDKWLSELRARFISVMGRLIWSSTPESATPTFYDLKTRSERPDMKDLEPYKRTEFFELLSKDNPYLPPLGLEAAKERLEEDDPEAASAKIDGEWTFRKFLVYPEFDETIHVIDPFPIEWRDSCYAITDPGRVRNGTLFVVLVHPDSPHYLPDQPDRIVVFDELLIQTARDREKNRRFVGINANSWADKFAKKWIPYKHWLEDITFDWSQGRKKDEFDVEIMERYRQALESRNVIPRNRNYVHAKSNITFGIEEVSKFLSPQDDRPPRFAIMRGKCPHLIHEFKKYQREQLKGSNGRLTPGKPIAKRNELVDCTRYACCRGFTWVQPPAAHYGSAAFTGQELRRMADNNKAFEQFMNRDFYAQFDRKKQKTN